MGTPTAIGPSLLDGLLVIEATDSPGAAFSAVLAADFGATVMVCEPPDKGSALRRLGDPAISGDWWAALARNKASLALDPHHPAAGPVLERLAGAADLLFRDEYAAPAVAEAAAASGRCLDVLMHPPGTDRPDLWPWSCRPEFAAAATGMMALTGHADGPAVQPEIPLADYTAGMMALMQAMAARRAADLAGAPPEPIALGLHEALLRMNEWQTVVATANARAERRNGNRFPMNTNIGNVFQTRDGCLLTVSAATPAVADRLLGMIGGEALRTDPRFHTHTARRENMDALEQVVAAWFRNLDRDEALRRVREADVVVGPIADAADIAEHPHIVARGSLAGSAAIPDRPPMPSVLPMIAPGGGRIVGPGPALGAGGDQALEAIGFTPREIAALRRDGVIWC